MTVSGTDRETHPSFGRCYTRMMRSQIVAPGRGGVVVSRNGTGRLGICALVLIVGGCSDNGQQQENREQSATASSVETPVVKPIKPRRRGPVQLGGPAGGDTASGSEDRVSEGGLDAVMDRMKPLQILLGQWRGITRKQQSLVPHQWVWDLKTNPAQPALVLTSAESPYFRDGRLTWLAKEQAFEFSGTNGDGNQQVLRGRFSQPPKQVAGDADDQPQMTFKLELVEAGETQSPESWKLVFNQQENNRMLVELSQRRGRGKFRLKDTIGCQREGTSFAISDTDYGEKTCVISQGLGTTAVSFKGKTYWVCCSGCKAAFEEEPEKWIARFEAMKAKKSSR